METNRMIVLVVDDEFEHFDRYESGLRLIDQKQAVLSAALGNRRIVPLYACDYNSAVESMKRHAGKKSPCGLGDVGLVITDFGIGGGHDGNDIAKYVKENFPGIPVVGNTGGDPDDFDKKYVDAAVEKIRDRNTLLNIVCKYAKRG